MMLGEVPVLSLFDRTISGFNHAVKWLEDKILTLAILALIWPLLLLVAIAVKLDSPGPVFFRPPREGYNNRTFHVLKLRSLRAEAQQVAGTVQGTRDRKRTRRNTSNIS